jgi:protein-L-isoaspartate(D-aspartate) O-methyltransferase
VEDRPLGGHDRARRAMIDSQLRTSGVSADFVLRRMAAVPRESFVPAAAREFAYIDRAVALGDGRFLAAPVVHGMMLQEARPTAHDRVLLVDGGSGYLAELLRPLVGALDVVAPDAANAKARQGDYTLLVIDGAVEQVPDALTRRLTADARAVAGLVEDGVTRLAVGRKTGNGIAFLPVAELGIPVLPEFAKPKAWSF